MNLDDLGLDDLVHLIEWAWHGAGELGRRSWLLIPILKKLYAMALARLRNRPMSATIKPRVLVNQPSIPMPTVSLAARVGLTVGTRVSLRVVPSAPRC